MLNETRNEAVWEERWHPLREEWVIVAAHRQNRPWSGEILADKTADTPEYVSDCYLCPRNLRVGGERNPNYSGAFVFDNDLPCVGENAPHELEKPVGIYKKHSADGIARVVCYSPQHNLTMAELEVSEIENVIKVWQEQFRELASRENVNHVLVFENKGEQVGVSNPHPHGQIYATNFVFKTIETEVAASLKFFDETGKILFAEIIKSEKADGRRVIFENETAIAFVPFFARYAYEVFVAPKKSHRNISELSAKEITDFAEALKVVTVKYDNLWKMPFPYVMPLH
ncbi:MAG: galactose-1-phosphate uridylyltransferase, partial [Acidobacteriota bacterium]|nr:galactose-1-phosphate uridylyltransferase [Acidobacteriota bacterium]